jgi:adenylate cyclase
MTSYLHHYQAIKSILLALLFLLLPMHLQAQSTPQPLTYWEKALPRQTDSLRKAEVLLYVSKEYETTDPARSLAYAQQSLAIGEANRVPKLIGLAALQLSRLHTTLGNKRKARQTRRLAEANLKDVDLMADLNRLENQKIAAEENAQAQQQAVVSSQQQVSALSSETQRKTRELTIRAKQLHQQTQLLGSKDALISQRDLALTKRDSVLTSRELELRFRADQIKLLEQERALQAAEAAYERTIRKALIAGATLLFMLAGLLWRLIATKQRTNRALAKKNAELDISRRRSDELLLNILPAELVEELKISGITQTRHHDEVTIMFTDFKDFTQISELLTPTELVREIDYCFRQFDKIIGKYPSIEKIKTIGDSYLCAGGLPDPHADHATQVVAAALEIRDFIANLCEERSREGRLAFQVRIGVHTGPVVAGVVGATKFAYDIWGDTVNTASRLETACEPGRVNISDATYQRISTYYACEHRGQVAAKNKAKMNMYFVDLLPTAEPVL